MAERDLRPSVIQRKLSYGTQSDEGSLFTERILTLVVTLKKRALSVLDYLTDCFESHVRDGPIPSPI
jgi:transposase